MAKNEIGKVLAKSDTAVFDPKWIKSISLSVPIAVSETLNVKHRSSISPCKIKKINEKNKNYRK